MVGHNSAGHKTLNYCLFIWFDIPLLEIRLELLTGHLVGYTYAGHKTLKHWLFIWFDIPLLDIRRWTIDCSSGGKYKCTSAGHKTFDYWLLIWFDIPLTGIRRWTFDCSAGWTYIYILPDVRHITVDYSSGSTYEGCSNMNASSFITFLTFMLRQNVIPFWKELFVAFKMAPYVKKHSLYFSSNRPK